MLRMKVKRSVAFAREIESQQLFRPPCLEELHTRLHYLVETPG